MSTHHKPLSIRQFISNLFTGTPRSSRKHLSRNRYGNLPAVESLERRTLLVAPIHVVHIGDTLEIFGTAAADDVLVIYNDDKSKIEISDGFTVTSIDSRFVKFIEFRGKAGDDVFTNATDLPTKAYGGAGDDTLFGGSGKDTLYGNGGRDILNGGNGNDEVRGGSGNDTVKGGKGNDSLFGSRGNDVLQGGSGNDWMFGGIGNDILFGGPGNDHLSGGLGDDINIGGDGFDDIDEGNGFDVGQPILSDLETFFIVGAAQGDQRNSAQLQDGNLFINGSDKRDVINVKTKGSFIQVRFAGKGGKTTKFFSPFVKKIFVAGEGGNDSINIRKSVKQDVYALGGAGNDIIRSFGTGHNFVVGGKGKDTLEGGSGGNHFFGGPAKDKDRFRKVGKGGHVFKRSLNRNDLKRILGEDAHRRLEQFTYVIANAIAADKNEHPVPFDGVMKEFVKELNGFSPLSIGKNLDY